MAKPNRINGLNDLEVIKEAVDTQRKSFAFQAMVCSGTPCQASDSLSLKEALINELANRKLT
ncbi:MAG: (2Fe-2S) ferredoxin domain-containing protein, partial [bacterium]